MLEPLNFFSWFPPVKSNALAAFSKSPLRENFTSQTFTSGVNPEVATNLLKSISFSMSPTNTCHILKFLLIKTFHMETLWSNMSDCGRCQAWSTPTRFKESLNYLNIKYTSPFRFQIRSSVLSLQVAMNFPVAAMPIPITSVRCTCQQNLHLQHIGLPYLGESYCHAKISQSPVSLLGHFVNL